MLKKSKLIQPLQAQLPQLFVIELAFFEGQFTPDHFVAGGRVSLEFYATHRELLAFVNIDVE